MKVSAYIFLFSLVIISSYPMIEGLQIAQEQSLSGFESCCCDHSQDACCDEGTEPEREKDHTCDTGCECACHFHFSAVYFQFNKLQMAEEQEYHYGEYVDSYSFEYFSLHLPPPRLA
jgi:hypothetical protein